MSLTIPSNLSKPATLELKLSLRQRPTIVCSVNPSNQEKSGGSDVDLKALSAVVALSSILLSTPMPMAADISRLTSCKESKKFVKREKQSIKKLELSSKLYVMDSASALAIKVSVEKTKQRFDNYPKQGLLCGVDGLPHLIIAKWIGWVGRSYLIAIRDEKKPTMKAIIIDVPFASRLLFRGFSWPVTAYRELINGDLIAKDV
ncbi:hypothetical protein Fmac_025421 [Flemingia macrophylla]|uniref:Photosystem I reaction center subunit III n=1 Tax=Flemingia macrophylla TaxID=520843 RepID=A0ABD1LS80_9FABA